MGFDLIVHTKEGDSKYFRWNSFDWGRLLLMAYEHGGWKPEGTIAPGLLDEDGNNYYRGKGWDGGYSSNDFQVIKETDARNLASALRKVLVNFPSQDWMDVLSERLGLEVGATVEVVWNDNSHQRGDAIQSRAVGESKWHTSYIATDPEYFAACGRWKVEDFVEFCESGSILIG